jgi:hypothetical protein
LTSTLKLTDGKILTPLKGLMADRAAAPLREEHHATATMTMMAVDVDKFFMVLVSITVTLPLTYKKLL